MNTEEKKVVEIYDSIRNLLLYFNKGNGLFVELQDLQHDVFLSIHSKIDDITYPKAYLYKTCYWAYWHWLKGENMYMKRKVELTENLVIADEIPEVVDFIQLHPIQVDSTVAIKFVDGKVSYYPSATEAARELNLSKSAVQQWINNGGVSFKSYKTKIIEEITNLDFIYNPFKNGIKIVKRLSFSTFQKSYNKPDIWRFMEKNEKYSLYVNKFGQGLIVKNATNES